MLKLHKTGLMWLWVSVLVLFLDRWTKGMAEDYLSLYSTLSVCPGFNLVLSYNTGAAFSFLDSASGWQGWFFGGIAISVTIGILIWLQRIHFREYKVAIALSFIAGGALGNLWDRLQYGHVIDFIQLYAGSFYWPAFNIADSAICVGAALFFLSSFSKKKVNMPAWVKDKH